jgi:hypothetical protein
MDWKVRALRALTEDGCEVTNANAMEIAAQIRAMPDDYPFGDMPISYAVLNAAEEAVSARGDRPTYA